MDIILLFLFLIIEGGLLVKKLIVAVLGLTTVIGLILMSSFFTNDREDIETVATINGEPIQSSEFLMILNYNYAAKTYNYFSNTYGVKDYKGFWSNVYGDEKPIEYAANLVLEELVRIKSEQILMKEYGVITDATYEFFSNELQKENNRRKIAVEKKEVIYGPEQYSDYQYYSHVFSTNVNKLKRILEKERFTIQENDLREAYEHMKEDYFMNPYHIQVEKISMSKTEQADEIMKKLRGGDPKDNVLEKIKKANKDILIETQTFNEDSAKTDYELNPKLLVEAKKIKAGEISGIIDENNRLTIMKGIAVKERGFQDFDTVKEQIIIQMIDEKYEELVQNRMKNTDVKIMDKALERIVSKL